MFVHSNRFSGQNIFCKSVGCHGNLRVELIVFHKQCAVTCQIHVLQFGM